MCANVRYGVPAVLYICLIVLVICSALEEKIPEEEKEFTCAELEDPKNGKYQCRMTPEGKICKLICNEGYALPINEYHNDGQHVKLEHRGVHACVKTVTGMVWYPSTFYDCITQVYPAYFVFYYSLTSTPPLPCTNDSERASLLSSFVVNDYIGITKTDCRRHLFVNCDWTYDMRCLKQTWAIDAWLRIPFSLDMLETFDIWYYRLERETGFESANYFVVPGQSGASVVNRFGFYIECPAATRIERDYTCRGCSRGYYMSQSLLECLPCPAHRYQDQDYAFSCKPCPPGGTKETVGLTKLIDCFHFSYWEEGTGLDRIFGGLACIVLFSTLMLFYRSHIRNEPDGRHRELYKQPKIQAVGGGRLQRLMRMLYPMAMYPSQFDDMTVAAQLGSETTWARFMESSSSSGSSESSASSES